MMTENIDIWRAAKLLVDQHGKDASHVAAQRADGLLDKGDTEGQLVWKRILATVEELLREKPRAGERVN